MKAATFLQALWFVTLSVTLAPGLESPSSCSQAEIVATAAKVDSARAALRHLPIGDGMQTDVSPDAQQAISAMKTALGDFIVAYMRCVSVVPNAGEVEREVSQLTHAFRLPSGELSNEQIPADFGTYGFELSFDVKVMQDPSLVGVTATFSIECGSDSVLFIFGRESDQWHEVLRWQNKRYDTVGGGTMAFDYGVSPEDEAHQWYVVVHNIAPWCSSTWSSIRYAAMRPSGDPLQPRVLLSAEDYMWWGNEDFGTLSVAKNSFDLRFHSSSIDSGVHNRVFIRHFVVQGDTVRRTQPVAVSPRDFVDEWIVSNWKEASQWSAKSSIAHLARAHKAMSRQVKSYRVVLDFESVVRCSGNDYQVQLGMTFGPKFDTGRSVYFILAGSNPYQMVRVSSTPATDCGGRNLLHSMETK